MLRRYLYKIKATIPSRNLGVLNERPIGNSGALKERPIVGLTILSAIVSILIFTLGMPTASPAYFHVVGDSVKLGSGQSDSGDTGNSQIYWMIPGKSVRENLIEWGKQAGWTVIWELSKDMPVVVKANMGTDFKTALRRVQISLRHVNVRIHIAMHHGDKTVVVSSSAF